MTEGASAATRLLPGEEGRRDDGGERVLYVHNAILVRLRGRRTVRLNIREPHRRPAAPRDSSVLSHEWRACDGMSRV